MSDRILKKSFIGGFKKSDVLDYIEKLQAENHELKEKLENAESESADLLEELRSENSALSGEKEELTESLKALTEEKEKLQADYDALLEENKKYSGSLSGSLVQDAMKYSDSLVAEAKKKAEKVLEDTAGIISGLGSEVGELSSRVDTAQVNLDYSFNSVRSSVKSLLDNIEESKTFLTGEK